MRRPWLVIPLAIALVVVLWILARGTDDIATLTSALGFEPASDQRTAAQKKPICSQVIVPAGTDCIPQHLAKLPPDPGPAGMKTIEGIDSDNDGVRDDVQRFIAEHWGHSERAVAVLTKLAKAKQIAVVKGDSVTREEARVLVQPMLDAGSCYIRALDQSVWDMDALEKVGKQVTNTPERRERAHAFNYKAAHTLYMAKEGSVVDICGFDPAQFSN